MVSSDLLMDDKKEIGKHGNHLLPLRWYGVSLSSDFPMVPAHWHEEAELTLIQSGSCMYHIDLCDYPVEAGDIILLPPAVLHSAGSYPSYRMCSETFVFHMNFLGVNAADICSLHYLLPFSSGDLRFPYIFSKSHALNPRLRDLMERLSAIYRTRPEGYELLLRSYLLELFFMILPYKLPVSRESTSLLSQSEKLKNVLDYIDNNFSSPITIENLAKICCFSDSHFMRFFKLHVGMTCTEYINTIRLEKAWQQLKEGNTSVIDTAFSCGFHNLSYFYRLFKKRYHMTPKEVLK